MTMVGEGDVAEAEQWALDRRATIEDLCKQRDAALRSDLRSQYDAYLTAKMGTLRKEQDIPEVVRRLGDMDRRIREILKEWL